MPIYEFYCSRCHMIFNFFARTFETTKRPDCPRCGKKQLERRPSVFSIGKKAAAAEKSEGGEEEDFEDDLPPGLDEEKLEKIFDDLADEVDSMDEEDPRQMARLMRKLGNSMGVQFGPAMEEAIRRLEAGEDPDQIEEDLGDALENEEPIFEKPEKPGKKGARLKTLAKKLLPPRVDPNIYDL
jgi:putative FmdB family regulatory protein